MTETVLKLSNATLHKLPQHVAVPAYDRSKVKASILHFGTSAFFRGHLAVIADDCLNRGEMDMGICAVSVRTPDARDALREQDYLYTVVEQGADGNNARVVGSITDVLVAPEDPEAVLRKMESPDTQIVTLTVTQAGYYYRNGDLDFEDPEIKKDLGKFDEPTTTVGFLVAGLDRRRKAGMEPFIVMSCDNLTGNGTILRNVVLAYAAQISPELKSWIETEVSFPSTMVDRIVPKTTPTHVASHPGAYGYHDNWPIRTEPMPAVPLVIENKHGKGSMSLVGEWEQAMIVSDAAPYELMKIRMLNGTHMALGMIGRMAGYTYTHEAMKDPAIRAYILDFMGEMQATLQGHGVSEEAQEKFKADTIRRLENPTMKDELCRLARNGVDKLDSRFLQALRDARAKNTPSANITFAAATWIEYLKRSGEGFDIFDAKALSMGLPDKARRDGATPSTLIATEGLFGKSLSSSEDFIEELTRDTKAICANRENILKALSVLAEGDSRRAAPTEAAPSVPVLGQ